MVVAGYQASLTDREGGLISTNRQALMLTAEQADCGKEAGIPYIEEEATQTEVSVKLRAEDGRLWVLVKIHGRFAPSKLGAGVPLICVSTGSLEPEIAQSVLRLL